MSNRIAVYASSADFPHTRVAAKERLRRIDDHDTKLTIAKVNGRNLDYSWLRGASETYQISPNIQDYLLTEVPIVSCDLPNRNLHCFSYDEVSYFDPRFGRFVYQTFIGKPTYADHCFPAGTMIRMLDDKRVSIERVKVGDEVLTASGQYHKVVNTFSNGVKDIWRFSIAGLKKPLKMTHNHPVLSVRRDVVDEPRYRPADELHEGDYVCVPPDTQHNAAYGVSHNGMLMLPIRSIDRDVAIADVFNLEVEQDHSYVANDIIVHNCNKNFVEAKGVHFDATLRKVPGWNVWKIYVLLGYDRTKDPALVKRIERGERRGYSMGAWVGFFLNSITGQIANGTQELRYPLGTVHDGVLSYLNCSSVEFFETSSVLGPADVSAESNQLWYF